MRRFLVLALALLTAACGGGSSSAKDDKTEPPPLSVRSPSAPPPKSTHKPGPPLKPACQLASPSLVASALKVPKPKVLKTDYGPPKVNRGHCRYQLTGQWVELVVTSVTADNTPQQAVNEVIQQYTGPLEQVPGLGDAALYTGGSAANKNETLVTARLEGTQMRTITLDAFLDGHSKEGLVKLARAILGRI